MTKSITRTQTVAFIMQHRYFRLSMKNGAVRCQHKRDITIRRPPRSTRKTEILKKAFVHKCPQQRKYKRSSETETIMPYLCYV